MKCWSLFLASWTPATHLKERLTSGWMNRRNQSITLFNPVPFKTNKRVSPSNPSRNCKSVSWRSSVSNVEGATCSQSVPSKASLCRGERAWTQGFELKVKTICWAVWGSKNEITSLLVQQKSTFFAKERHPYLYQWWHSYSIIHFSKAFNNSVEKNTVDHSEISHFLEH